MIWISLTRIARRFGFAMLMLVMTSGAWASCTGGGQTFALALPSTVSVARDLPAGALLTNWVSSPASTNLWTCSGGAFPGGVRAEASAGFNTNSGQVYSSGGVTYTVWNTNVPGVGIAIGFKYIFTPSGACKYSGGWTSLADVQSSWYGLTCDTRTVEGPAGSQAYVALVKTGTVASGGVISGTFAQTAPANGTTLSNLAVSYTIGPVTIVPMTCTTPDVNVPMGTFQTSDFPAVGSLSPRPASFNVQFLNCPAGAYVTGTLSGKIDTVQYQIDPTNGTLATNVAQLSGSPSATGVGIQLFTSSGAVFPLSSMQSLSAFDGSSGGNYTIPMTARYYRTGTVTPGPANTTMTLTVLYQ